jgi:hypothetical protein
MALGPVRIISYKSSGPKLSPNALCVIYIHGCFIFICKVEDGWKTTEFIVLPHRDSKDVFILGGIDDIQVQLDDSQVRFLE